MVWGMIICLMGLAVWLAVQWCRSAFLALKLQAAMSLMFEDARRDPLTQVGNRLALNEYLESQHEEWQKYQVPCALVFIDLDHFKQLNDTWGHLAGDEVLRVACAVWQKVLLGRGHLVRFGGEEFVLFLPQMTVQEARQLAEELRQAFVAQDWRALLARVASQSGPPPEEADVALTMSAGVAEFTGEDDTPEGLLFRADQRLLAAKRSGRNRVC